MNRKDLSSSKKSTKTNQMPLVITYHHTQPIMSKNHQNPKYLTKKDIELQKVLKQKSVIVIKRNKSVQKIIWGHVLCRKILKSRLN